ncbi:hypothetical protein TEA_024474 [Camellia sinensis var. sinensis]|uniref:Auxin response factor n=1 Tax=Camellia sinensis var. sinensis TaxID=542762 RepID=A0A4S4DNN7_CAMSN|nr:hypothetical protein TEA_024474 [Camellia sinensis var. sinensis]
MANTTELRQVEPTVWKACAGTSVQIPTVDSRVYYFPQGHAEQASSPPFLSPLVSSQPLILCRVAAVLFLANSDTDEVFAKIRLLPLLRSPNPDCSSRGGDVDVDVDEDAVVSFAKILTPSDANNGGGFSVPRFCADSIFPPLNFAADPPVQTLSITDVHGVVWEFRHIYRGTPRRHLLTTGWSKFVNHKKLIAGDSVVFMRNRRSGEFFIGVRRAVRSNADCGGRWNSPVGSVRVKTEEDGNRKEGFSRNGKGRVSAESVSEAAELAAQGMGFEVVYYPRVGWADFVVKAETVEESLSVFWTAGVRVKMGMETEDSSRMTWFQGTVSSATVPDNGPWRGSPWRMLQACEPHILLTLMEKLRVHFDLQTTRVYVVICLTTTCTTAVASGPASAFASSSPCDYAPSSPPSSSSSSSSFLLLFFFFFLLFLLFFFFFFFSKFEPNSS